MQGTDGHLLVCSNTGSNNSGSWRFENIKPPTGVRISRSYGCISLPDSPYLFVLGTDGALWHSYCVNGQWVWVSAGSIPVNGVSIAGSVGVTTCEFRPYVYVRGSDGNLWQSYWTGSQWVWVSVSSPNPAVLVTVPVAALSVTYNSGLVPFNLSSAFVICTDGNLWQNTLVGSNWQWVNLGAPSTAVGIKGAIGGSLSPDGRLQVFVLGSDNNLWQCYQQSAGGNWTWFGMGAPSATVAIGPSVGAVTNGVAVIGSDGRLWRNIFESSWTWERYADVPALDASH
jgi:hypothetical protein